MSCPLSPGEVHADGVTSRGHLDDISFTCVRGWAWDRARPDERIVLIVCVGDRVLARIFADQTREDLKGAGIGDGRHGFEFQLNPPLPSNSDHMIAVRKECDGEHLAGSPRLLKGMSTLSDEEKADIASRLSNACEGRELDVRLNFMAEQLEILRQRRSALRSPPHAGRTAALMTGPARRRALVIDDTAPRLANDAGSNAILSHVRSLQRLGFAVSFAPSDLAPTSVFEETGVDCWRSPELSSIEEGLRRRTGHFDIVYLHRISNASRYIALVREHQPRARLIFSVADLHHLRLTRQAEIEERAELARFALQVRAEELSAAARSDAVITHSSAEASLLRKALPRTAVYVVPWAVPLQPTSKPFARRQGIAFIAHYGHKPNVDAAQWLVTEVLPAIERSGSSIPCILAGTAMPEHLRKLQRSNVEIAGAVDDLATVFDRVRLTVAPLAFGAGLKGKVLDSLAAGVPCVCTPTAAEGLHLPAPLNEQISASVEGFAASILRLHDDPALNAACRAVGLAFVEAFASEENVEGLLREALGDRC